MRVSLNFGQLKSTGMQGRGWGGGGCLNFFN